MKRRELKFAPAAQADMADAWQLVYVNDGEQRADLEPGCSQVVGIERHGETAC